jgi:hypothetical protein
MLSAGRLAVAAQRPQQFGGKHHVTILLAFALFNPDNHPLAINIRGLQAQGLGDAQACSVAGRQNRSMFRTAYAPEKMENFLGAQDNRQLLRLLRRWNSLVERPVPFE